MSPGAARLPAVLLAACVIVVGAVLSPNMLNLSFTDTEICLGCICEATSNCNMTIGCLRDLCGPLLIAYDYWLQAGAPSVAAANRNSRTDYEKCVHNPKCAATTVRNYVSRFAQDCNQDGRFDCDDVAHIHYLGGMQCQLSIEHTGYYRVFHQCIENVQQFLG